MYQHYLANPPTDPWPPGLALLVSAGARLERATVQAFHARFGVKIHSFYGASECGGITFDGDEAVDDLATVGRPLPGVTVTLRSDPDVPAGCGRIHVSGPAVSCGYVGDRSESDVLSDGGFLTGDYGSFAPDGRLVLAGRISGFINVAGRKVQPGEVERVLRDLDGVLDVRVLPVPDPSRGEQIAAVVATGGRSELTLGAVRRHCAGRLPPHKIPRIVVFVPELPVSARGKTDHRALHALIEARAVSSP
jgi:long-chain acyl-CoA synthetase